MNRIDFHAHILPGADHGSDSVSTSLFQLEQAQLAGVGTIVATPHFYPERHRAADFLARREQTFERLCQAYRGDIRLLPAAEVLLCEGLSNLPELAQLCIPNTNVLLIEMPMGTWSRRQIDAVCALRDDAGFTVVLAHVDRYVPQQVEALLARGFLAQLNAENVCRFWGRKRLLGWVRSGSIVALGSDIHGKSAAYSSFNRACSLLGELEPVVMSRTVQLLGTRSAAAHVSGKSDAVKA